jgi:hypothetical protein
MRLRTFAAGIAAFAVTALVLDGVAEAQTKRRPYARSQGTVYTVIDEGQRPRSRIIVTPRSYLDAGTEVLPGERKYNDYVWQPGYSPTQNIDVFSPSGSFRRMPLSDPWDLPGFPKTPW